MASDRLASRRRTHRERAAAAEAAVAEQAAADTPEAESAGSRRPTHPSVLTASEREPLVALPMPATRSLRRPKAGERTAAGAGGAAAVAAEAARTAADRGRRTSLADWRPAEVEERRPAEAVEPEHTAGTAEKALGPCAAVAAGAERIRSLARRRKVVEGQVTVRGTRRMRLAEAAERMQQVAEAEAPQSAVEVAELAEARRNRLATAACRTRLAVVQETAPRQREKRRLAGCPWRENAVEASRGCAAAAKSVAPSTADLAQEKLDERQTGRPVQAKPGADQSTGGSGSRPQPTRRSSRLARKAVADSTGRREPKGCGVGAVAIDRAEAASCRSRDLRRIRSSAG